MSVILATDSNYADLIALPGLTSVMYDYPKMRFGNDRKLRAAFRKLASLQPEVRLVYVDMTQLAGLVGKTPYCPTFRMYREGNEVGQWYTNLPRSDQELTLWAECFLPEEDRTQLGRMEYPLKHDIRLIVGSIREPVEIRCICEFLADAMARFKKLSGPFKGPYYKHVRQPRKRAICYLSLSYPGDGEGNHLPVAQWLEAVIWAYCSADTLDQMAEQAEEFRANAHTDPSGWIVELVDTLAKPYGHLKALRKMYQQAEKWEAENE